MVGVKRQLAYLGKYIWWEDTETLINENPIRIIAAAMSLANDSKDYAILRSIPEYYLKQTIKKAQPGWIDKKSWHYWHHILDLTKSGETVPPLPQRGFLNDAS